MSIHHSLKPCGTKDGKMKRDYALGLNGTSCALEVEDQNFQFLYSHKNISNGCSPCNSQRKFYTAQFVLSGSKTVWAGKLSAW